MTDRTKIKFTIPVLILLSAFINYYVASRGAFPVDTFVHFDNGFRILEGEYPIKDYWIVHGLLVDYMQSIFFGSSVQTGSHMLSILHFLIQQYVFSHLYFFLII